MLLRKKTKQNLMLLLFKTDEVLFFLRSLETCQYRVNGKYTLETYDYTACLGCFSV